MQTRRNFIKATGFGILTLPQLITACATSSSTSKSKSFMVYVGTYAKPDQESIFGYHLNPNTGELSRAWGMKGGENPSYLTLDSKRKFLFAANETTEYKYSKSGSVSAFSLDAKTGTPTLLNQLPSLGGAPCYITLDKTEKLALVANYVGGNVSIFPVQANGNLDAASDVKQHSGTGFDKKRQTSPHAHCIIPSPDNKFVFAVDLTLDKIFSYKLETGTAKLIAQPKPAFVTKPGAGPRHLTFHPNGRFAFLINELNSTMVALNYNAASGSFTEIQAVSTLPEDFKEASYCADVHVSPDGKFLYGSNRGHNSIVVFAITPDSGKLTLVQHVDTGGKWPRNFTLDPTGQILLVANQNTNNIVTFRVDKQTGQLTPTGVNIEVPSPVCLKVVTDFG